MFEFITEEEPPFLWTSLEGKLISDDDAKNLMDNTSQFISKKTNTIVVDMKKLNYMNSSGFNQLLKLLSLTRNHGGDIYLCNINSNVDALLITTKLNTIFKIKKNIKNLEDFKKQINYGS